MTSQQQQVLDLASRLGVDPDEVTLAVRLAQTGRVDLLVRVTAQRMSIRAALKEVARSNSPRDTSRARRSIHGPHSEDTSKNA
jgi:CO/xanthine dehydrogenase Mo-binding subunit